MQEFWLPVPHAGFADKYEVSSTGNIRNCLTGKILSPNWTQKGYRQVFLFPGGGPSKVFRVHRLVLETFVGPPPPGCEADHIDRDRSNNALSNLRWVTKSENNKNRRDSRPTYLARIDEEI